MNTLSTESLPSLEAWIETDAVFLIIPAGNVASFIGSVDGNLVSAVKSAKNKSRFLHWKRGLKPPEDSPPPAHGWSLPSLEAWIETVYGLWSGVGVIVASFIGSVDGNFDNLPVVKRIMKSLPSLEAWIETACAPGTPTLSKSLPSLEAWIETIMQLDEVSLVTVASFIGSVDGNNLPEEKDFFQLVASFIGSVDGNPYCAGSQISNRPSLPSLEAWIETHQRCLDNGCAKVASFIGSVDGNISLSVTRTSSKRRFLHWKRGLKRHVPILNVRAERRFLHWKRGLKQQHRSLRHSKGASLPSLEAWIETPVGSGWGHHHGRRFLHWKRGLKQHLIGWREQWCYVASFIGSVDGNACAL